MYHNETSHTEFLWVEDVPYWFYDQKIKVQGHTTWLLKMVYGA